jgi:hypothetical protein
LALSSQSTESNGTLEVDASATAVPMIQASPTTIRIRHLRTASQPPDTPSKIQNLHDIAQGAVHGDIGCQTEISNMYQDISNADTFPASSSYTESEQHLIKKARLALGLEAQKAAERMPPGLVEKVSAQLFPRHRNEVIPMEAFAAYIC